MNALVDGPDDFSTVISFRDNNTGVAKDLQRAARQAADKSGDRALTDAFQDIDAMCSAISLSRQVVDISKQLYKRVDEEKMLKSKPTDAVIAACIFIACRQARVPRTFKEIVALTGVDKKKLATCFKFLRLAFEGTGVSDRKGGEDPQADTGGITAGQISASAEDIVVRYGSNLALPPAVSSAAGEVVRHVTNLGLLAGRSPITVATACIYFASHLFGHPKPAKDIAAVGGIAEGTIRHAYK